MEPAGPEARPTAADARYSPPPPQVFYPTVVPSAPIQTQQQQQPQTAPHHSLTNTNPTTTPTDDHNHHQAPRRHSLALALAHAPPVPIADDRSSPPPPPPPPAPTSSLSRPRPRPPLLRDARAHAESALREYLALRGQLQEQLMRQQLLLLAEPGDADANVGVGVGGPVDGVGAVGGEGGGAREGEGEGEGKGKGKGGPHRGDELAARVRAQARMAADALAGAREAVGEVILRGEGQRWRRLLVGGLITTIIPTVKALFRRPRHSRDESESSSRTEYAFRKSKELIARVLAATTRPGIGTVAFFVFAVLYVFQNEVSLRTARTVSRRLDRLVSKVESGQEVTEDDMKVLKGWRWRILAWSD